MKILTYNLLQGMTESGDPILIEKTLSWSEANEEIAKREAYDGYTPGDDGLPEPVVEPTAEEMFNALLGVTE